MSAELLAAMKRIEAKLDAVLAKRQQEERSKPAPAAANVATDADLDSQYGDPKCRFMPRDWAGDSFKGATASQCPADLCDMMANTLEYFADKNAASDPKKAGYDRKDAARFRGWAIRKRNGWKPTEETPAQRSYDFDDSDTADDDIGF